MWIVRNVSVIFDAVPIIPLESIEGTDPDETLFVPNHTRANLIVENPVDSLEVENREEPLLCGKGLKAGDGH